MRQKKVSLLQRIQGKRMPREGELVQIYQHQRLIASGLVVAADNQTVSIAGRGGLIDLDTLELRRGLNDGSIVIKRE